MDEKSETSDDYVLCAIPRTLYEALRGEAGNILWELPNPLTHVLDPQTGESRRIQEIVYAPCAETDTAGAVETDALRPPPEAPASEGCHVSIIFEGGQFVQRCVGSCEQNRECRQDTSVTSSFLCKCQPVG
jgi:hypothetical protein